MTPKDIHLLTIDELITEFRDYKLNIINSDSSFSLSEKLDSEVKDKLDFISEVFTNDIISGSFALQLLGLLDRKSNDIDILIDDKNRYDKYLLGEYDDEFSTPNRLGIKEFKWKKNFLTREKTFYVDFFENKNSTFLSFQYGENHIKIHSPIEIMQYKLEIIQNKKIASQILGKHNEDLAYIFRKANLRLILKKIL